MHICLPITKLRHTLVNRCSVNTERCLAASLLAASVLLVSRSPALAETRFLKVLQIHTQERAIVAYERDGRYLPSGLSKLNYLLRDWRKNKEIKIDPHVLDVLWQVYRDSGSNDYIHIVCGYRTAETNNMLRGRSRASGVAKESQHILGKAIDFYIPNVPLERVREIGMRLQDGGVGYYPHSGAPFVHMDTGHVRAWPRMSRQQLVRLFPDGRTLHLPQDGRPLPGYQIAMAEYKRRMSGRQTLLASASENTSGSSKNLLASIFGGKETASTRARPLQAAASPARDVAGVVVSARAVPIPMARPDMIVTASISATLADDRSPLPQKSVSATPIDVAVSAAVPVPEMRPPALAYAPSADIERPEAFRAAAPAARSKAPERVRGLTVEDVARAGRQQLRTHPDILIAWAELSPPTASVQVKPTPQQQSAYVNAETIKGTRAATKANAASPRQRVLSPTLIVEWAASRGLARQRPHTGTLTTSQENAGDEDLGAAGRNSSADRRDIASAALTRGN